MTKKEKVNVRFGLTWYWSRYIKMWSLKSQLNKSNWSRGYIKKSSSRNGLIIQVFIIMRMYLT